MGEKAVRKPFLSNLVYYYWGSKIEISGYFEKKVEWNEDEAKK